MSKVNDRSKQQDHGGRSLVRRAATALVSLVKSEWPTAFGLGFYIFISARHNHDVVFTPTAADGVLLAGALALVVGLAILQHRGDEPRTPIERTS